jgi:hypothetical protein
MRTKYFAAFLSCGMASCAHAATLYVKTTGSSNCSSWTNACSLTTALSTATSGDQVWVKSGTYTGTFEIPNAVKVIGGFAGTETTASQSDPSTNETILDGGDAERAVWVEDCASSTLLRGFTIRNGADDSFEGGGGMMVLNSSALIVQCVLKENVADYFGGAVTIDGASAPQFINCKFHANGTGSGTTVIPLGGGAVFVREGTPTFTNCLFYGNKAGDGGAVLIQDGAPIFQNCTIANNEATFGGGGGVFDQMGDATFKNCISWDNAAAIEANELYNRITGETQVDYTDLEGGWTGTGNINSNPSFVNAGSGDYKLAAGSPCKDVGSNSLLPVDIGDLDWDSNTTETLPKDLAGTFRKIDSVVDMGAYEAPVGIED